MVLEELVQILMVFGERPVVPVEHLPVILQEQLVFELIAINNYTQEETAKQLGITRRQVRYKYSIIVDRILDYFKKKGINSIEELL